MNERFSQSEVRPVKELLDLPKKIVITTHHKPDGDAMGSALGLYNSLIQEKHIVSVIIPSSAPEFLHWLPGNSSVIDFEKSSEKAKNLISNTEIIFCLDYNALGRIEGMAPFVEQSKAIKILIDHHLTPGDFCDYIFSYPDSCATSELIYDFIHAINRDNLINKNVAECLYTGIMTDTASFRYSTMSAQTHRIIAKLMDAGAENYKIHELVYDNFSADRMRFLGYCIKDKLEVIAAYNAALIAVSTQELKKFNHKTGDTEGIVNFALGIKGIRLAAFFVERNNEIKISFRSKNEFSVKDFANKHFQGGGHKNAAGGRSELSLEETVKKFIELLSLYKEALTK